VGYVLLANALKPNSDEIASTGNIKIKKCGVPQRRNATSINVPAATSGTSSAKRATARELSVRMSTLTLMKHTRATSALNQ
jgi:hypothetical protein